MFNDEYDSNYSNNYTDSDHNNAENNIESIGYLEQMDSFALPPWRVSFPYYTFSIFVH